MNKLFETYKSILLFVLIISPLYSKSKDFTTTASGNFFIENKGQWPDEVLFLSSLNGLNTWITKFGVVYDFYKKNDLGLAFNDYHFQNNEPFAERIGHIVSCNYLNSNENVTCVGKEKCDFYYNYFVGNDKNQWKNNVQIFKEVLVKNIYDKIDIHYYFENNYLRYDFVLQPGAEPNDITFTLDGSNETIKNIGNELILETSIGNIHIGDLKSYQYNQKNKNKIRSHFEIDNNQIKLITDAFDKNAIMIIDPLVWSTFIGGSQDDYYNDVVLDANNNVYVTGYTSSSNYPTTIGSYNTSFTNFYDIIVTKFSSNGAGPIFSTFIGGTSDDRGYSLALDNSNNIFLSGGSTSGNYPTTVGTFDQVHNGSNDVIITKINSLGTSLIFSSFLGGSGTERGSTITLDNNKNIYLSGNTDSFDYPTISGCYDQTFSGGFYDAFVTKLDSNASTLIYSTYIGGMNTDISRSHTNDGSGNLYLTGYTDSGDFPSTAGAFGIPIAAIKNVFVTKINPSGTSLIYSTSIGIGEATDITIDKSNNVILTGNTDANNYPITSGAYKTIFNSPGESFITKLNQSGNNLIFSTFIGGNNNYDYANSISLDSTNNIIITGNTFSNDYPTTINCFDGSFNGGTEDVFVSKINSNGSSLDYSTFIGGSSNEISRGIATNTNGIIFIVGETKSNNFPTTIGAFDQSFNGGVLYGDAFIAKICSYSPTLTLNSNSPLCVGQTLNLNATGGTTYLWNGPNSFTSNIQNPTINNIGLNQAGTYTLSIQNYDNCPNSGTLNLVVNQCTEIKEITDYGIIVLPNPTTDDICISLNSLTSETGYIITDLQGRLISEGDLTNYKNNINFNFSSGVYILDIRINNSTHNRYKIIKQ